MLCTDFLGHRLPFAMFFTVHAEPCHANNVIDNPHEQLALTSKRKAKAACSHALPKCGRCIRRAISSQCTYKPLLGKSKAGDQHSVHAARIERSHGPHFKLSRSLVLSVSQQSSSSEKLIPTSFFGPTNYAAIFRENQVKIGENL